MSLVQNMWETNRWRRVQISTYPLGLTLKKEAIIWIFIQKNTIIKRGKKHKPRMCFSLAGRSTWFVARTIAMSNSYKTVNQVDKNKHTKNKKKNTGSNSTNKIYLQMIELYLVTTVDLGQWDGCGVLKSSKCFSQTVLRSTWHILLFTIPKSWKKLNKK